MSIIPVSYTHLDVYKRQTLYEDAGDGYGYEKGEYCVTQITYCDKERKVEWKTEGRTEFRRGEFRVEIVG